MGCVHSGCNKPNEAEMGEKGRKSELGYGVDEKKVMWGLSLLRLLRMKQRKRKKKEGGLENNKAWLLADSDRVEAADSPSVHSFRFSFGSQVELEAMALASSSSATPAAVLMVNLEKNAEGSPSSDDSRKIRQNEILERSISFVGNRLIRLSYSEILSATQDFSRGNVLGRGANSCVFRGKIGFRRVVAIKRLENEDKESAEGFYGELTIASLLDNRNVVPLVGFCIAPEGLFLVYKYVSGGSLAHHLHGKMGIESVLSWSVRYRVALRIADAIAYLHNGNEKCVVHRDIKPSNILLTSKKSPKLCDFGLASWTPAPSVPFLCKTVKGTFGYLAPEYFQHGKVSDKTDVYAFGVVLLELLTGRKPIQTIQPAGEENLILWAKPLMQQEVIQKLLEPRLLLSNPNLTQVTRVVRAANACLSGDESARPSIIQALSILRGEEVCAGERSFICHFGSCNSQKKSDMQSHLALAMMDIPDFDHDKLCCR